MPFIAIHVKSVDRKKRLFSKQGFITTPLRENPETKRSFRRMKDGEVCDVCNNLYRILELLHEKDEENRMKCGNNGKN